MKKSENYVIYLVLWVKMFYDKRDEVRENSFIWAMEAKGGMLVLERYGY